MAGGVSCEIGMNEVRSGERGDANDEEDGSAEGDGGKGR